MPKISIIIPVHNTEKYVGECLRSVANQTFKDIEIIVVNDGSPDHSQTLIDKYAKKYPNIKSYQIENSGAGGARNYALERATGEYIGFVDSDDFIEPDMYEKLYNNIQEEDSDVVTCYMNYVIGEHKTKYIDCKINESTPEELIVYIAAGCCNKLFKRKLFEGVKFPEKVFVEDLAILPFLLAKANKISQVPEYLYNYRFQLNSQMVTNIKKIDTRTLDLFDALNNLERLFKENNLTEYDEELEGLTVTHILNRVLYLPFALNMSMKEKKKIYSLFINILDLKYPKWRDSKYHKNKRNFNFFLLFNLKLTQLLYQNKLRRKKYKLQTEEEIKDELEKIIKETSY